MIINTQVAKCDSGRSRCPNVFYVSHQEHFSTMDQFRRYLTRVKGWEEVDDRLIVCDVCVKARNEEKENESTA